MQDIIDGRQHYSFSPNTDALRSCMASYGAFEEIHGGKPKLGRANELLRIPRKDGPHHLYLYSRAVRTLSNKASYIQVVGSGMSDERSL